MGKYGILFIFKSNLFRQRKKRYQLILQAAHDWPGHIWLSTSGSSAVKWVGLSKKAILESAKAVNNHLKSHREDCWINALPHFHVGGLGILARAYLSGAAVFDFKETFQNKWNAEHFHRFLTDKKGTLTSLVPTQLYDLIALDLKAPSSLRAMIIGGGALLPNLYERAISLGWPILPSYGLTECASQVATAPLDSWKKNQIPKLQLLPHLLGREQNGCLCFSGDSVLSTYAYIEERNVRFMDPKKDNWFVTEDCGKILEGHLTLFGRKDAIYKVGGENIDLVRLENHLQALRLQLAIAADVVLVPMPDYRLGYALHLASDSENQEEIARLIYHFQQTVLPFERIRGSHFIKKLPRSPLGKIRMQELIDLLHN